MDTNTPKVDTLEQRLHEARRCQWEMERARLVADRDSWCEQAEQRTADAVEAFARAERAERENARLREALIEARNMLSERVRGYERYISALEDVCDSDQLARAQAAVPNASGEPRPLERL